MPDKPDTRQPGPPDPNDPLWRATVEMAEHARDPDVPEDADLGHAERSQPPATPETPAGD